jgi:hypothetical protein
MISQEQLRALLRYDPNTGWFTNLYDRNYNSLAGARVGSLTCSGRYRKVVINKVDYYEHTLAWFYVHGEWLLYLDHENGDGTENWLDNLRPANQSKNIANAHFGGSNSVSGVRGVYSSGRIDYPWRAAIQVNGKQIHLGHFDTIELAEIAYKEAAKLHFGEFAFHNRNPKARPIGDELLCTEGTKGDYQASAT